ncbi:hypothetical protein EOD42_10695 [Rhodovarius crocodyli]|uniref:Uncharacterized protein n=1 Tax=Rhodovarius crocodyli TaxID=1979269 RepID=A0A437MGT8_9PROT|nr:hypothetical protein EOD42_10695 [Rhodovarius crocodyli]
MRIASVLRRLAPLFLLATMLPACATIVSGTSNISVATEPPGATCALERRGEVVGGIASTPSMVRVPRSMRDMTLRCNHQAYGQGTTTVPSGINPMIIGNVLVGGLVGLAVDASTGAMGRYPEEVSLTLQPDPRLAGAGATDDTALLRRVMNERIAASRFICPRTGRSRSDCAAEVENQERERNSLGAAPRPAGPVPVGTYYLQPVTPGMFGS